MLRTLVEACWPCLVALAVCAGLLVAISRLAGGRLDLSRLRRLHRCQRGGIQSLGFVLALPLFIMIVLMIVQVSQLLVAHIVVNYAALAAARSISVWVPQHVVEADPGAGGIGNEGHPANVVDVPGFVANQPYLYAYLGGGQGQSVNTENVLKFDKPFQAATTLCAAISPSRFLGLQLEGRAVNRFDATWEAYALLAPRSAARDSMRRRLYNKLTYAYWNTELWITYREKNGTDDPSTNPRNNPATDYNSSEVGWQDPITVLVRHNLALLPGPGRLLARHLAAQDDPTELITGRTGPREGGGPGYARRVYTTAIWARATATNDGLKSVVPYVHVHETR